MGRARSWFPKLMFGYGIERGAVELSMKSDGKTAKITRHYPDGRREYSAIAVPSLKVFDLKSGMNPIQP